jgi:hypothetical protein
MKLPRTLALLVLCFVPPACRSTAAHGEVPCTCGQPAADIEGCAHSACVKGQRNPDNPDCVCGTLSIPK